MPSLQITIHDAKTGLTNTRDINENELAQIAADIAQNEKENKLKAKTEQAIADKRQIILDRLGITADELKTILS